MKYFTKWAVLPLLIVLAIAAGVYINKEVQQIKLRRQALNYQNQLIADFASLKSEISEGLENRLLDEASFGDFVSGLEKRSKKYNLNWSFGWLDEKRAPFGPEPGAANFSASAIGSYINVSAFLKDLKNSPYFIRWQELDFKNLGRNYEVNFRGRVFYK